MSFNRLYLAYTSAIAAAIQDEHTFQRRQLDQAVLVHLPPNVMEIQRSTPSHIRVAVITALLTAVSASGRWTLEVTGFHERVSEAPGDSEADYASVFVTDGFHERVSAEAGDHHSTSAFGAEGAVDLAYTFTATPVLR